MSIERDVSDLKEKVRKLEERVSQLESRNQTQASSPSANEGSVGIIYQGRVR